MTKMLLGLKYSHLTMRIPLKFREWVEKNPNFFYFLSFSLISIIIIVLQIFIITRLAISGLTDVLGLQRSNEIGDAIGGISAPLIGIVSSALVYLAFRQQLEANKIITKQYSNDNIVNTLNRVQDKYSSEIELKCKWLSEYLLDGDALSGGGEVISIVRKLNLFVYTLSYARGEIIYENNSESLRKFYSFIYISTFKIGFDDLLMSLDIYEAKHGGHESQEIQDFHRRLKYVSSIKLER